jgi:hypothetical protein
MEGHGFNATLLRDGKAVCEVIDDAHGGPYMFRWLDRDARATVHTLNYQDEPHQYPGTVEEAAFAAHCMALPSTTYMGREMRQSPETVVSKLIDAFELEKRLKRALKTKVIFIDGGREYSIAPKVKGTDPLLVVDAVKQRHPSATILNTLPLDEAVRLLLALVR